MSSNSDTPLSVPLQLSQVLLQKLELPLANLFDKVPSLHLQVTEFRLLCYLSFSSFLGYERPRRVHLLNLLDLLNLVFKLLLGCLCDVLLDEVDLAVVLVKAFSLSHLTFDSLEPGLSLLSSFIERLFFAINIAPSLSLLHAHLHLC